MAFDASDYHGVLGVKSGKRCAVAIWFTLDPLSQEVAHASAQTILRGIKKDVHRSVKDTCNMDSVSGYNGPPLT